MPDKFNPFRPNTMAGPDLFCGRLDELKIIDHCLLQTKNGNPQHFLIEGERGIGKSSILLIEKLVAMGKVETYSTERMVNFFVVSVSLSEKDDFYSILKKVASTLKHEVEQGHAIKTFLLSALDVISRIEACGLSYNGEHSPAKDDELLSSLQADFVQVICHLPERIDGVLLLIDEADKPPAEAGLGLLCKSLTEELTRQQCDKLCIGLAGLPALLDKLHRSHESSPRIFKTMSLRPLETFEREQVIDLGIKFASEKNGFKISITMEAIDLIATLSEGYPHFLQEFSYCAFEQDSDNIIDDKDVLDSLYRENGAFDQLGRKYFNRYYQAPGSDDYRKILITMADHFDDWITRANLIEESGLKCGTVDNGLRALDAKGVILKHESKPGHYRLQTRSFAVWIRATKHRIDYHSMERWR